MQREKHLEGNTSLVVDNSFNQINLISRVRISPNRKYFFKKKFKKVKIDKIIKEN